MGCIFLNNIWTLHIVFLIPVLKMQYLPTLFLLNYQFLYRKDTVKSLFLKYIIGKMLSIATRSIICVQNYWGGKWAYAYGFLSLCTMESVEMYVWMWIWMIKSLCARMNQGFIKASIYLAFFIIAWESWSLKSVIWFML